MTCEVKIASLQDRSLWDSIHSLSSIPSHGWPFASALSLSGIVPRIALVRDGSSVLVIPFHEREWRGRLDISTFLSVSGAWMNRPSQKLVAAWRGYAESRQWVAGFLQFEPETDVAGIAGAEDGNAVLLLDIGCRDPLAGVSAIIRRKIRRMDATGVRLIEDREVLAALIPQLYAATMERTGASSAYRLADAALRDMAGSLDHLILGAECGGEVIAIMVFPVSGERAEYHICASTAQGRDATAWLMWQAILRLKAMGVRRLNLGGGVRPGDGLYDFKLKFGAVPKPLHHVKQIYDAAAYENFCRAEHAAADEPWFPAYRARAARQPLVSGGSANGPEDSEPGDGKIEAHPAEAPHRMV